MSLVPVLIFGPILVLCVLIVVALCRAASNADHLEDESFSEIEVQRMSWPHENVLVMAGTSTKGETNGTHSARVGRRSAGRGRGDRTASVPVVLGPDQGLRIERVDRSGLRGLGVRGPWQADEIRGDLRAVDSGLT